MVLVLAVGLGAGLGAACRYGVDRLVASPWGTVIVNVIGSFLLGLLVGALYQGGELPPAAESTYALAGVGFCGGLTTFSTASLQVLTLSRESSSRTIAFAFGMLGASVLLAALGMSISMHLGLPAPL